MACQPRERAGRRRQGSAKQLLVRGGVVLVVRGGASDTR
jgi:hypothetical protein